MEKSGDHLDQILYDSFKDIEALGHNAQDYKQRMKQGFNEAKAGTAYNQKNSRGFNTAAISLITAGLLLGVIYTTGVQSSIIDLKYKVKTEVALIKSGIGIEK